jgi:hypothetical protein
MACPRKLCTVRQSPPGRPAWRGPAAPVLLAAALLAGGLLTAVTGCAKFDAALGQQEAVVQFKDGTANTTRLHVRAACSHIPQATPEALPTDHKASDLLYDVIYRVDNASNAQIAELEQCLQKYPSVVGIDIQTPGDS